MEAHSPKGSLRNLGTRLSMRRKKKLATATADPDAYLNGPRYLSQAESQELEKELLDEYKFSLESYVELAGLASSLAFSRCVVNNTGTQAAGGGDGSNSSNAAGSDNPHSDAARKKQKVLVVCGSGYGGLVGMVCARHLKLMGYATTVYYPEPSPEAAGKKLFQQLEACEVSALSYLPHESHLVGHAYDVVVDAIHDVSFTGVTDLLSSVIKKLSESQLPVFSIDVPAGWNVDSDDNKSYFCLEPEWAVSISAPKGCMVNFKGKPHFLACWFLPRSLVEKYSLNLPTLSGQELLVDMLDPKSFQPSTQPDSSPLPDFA